MGKFKLCEILIVLYVINNIIAKDYEVNNLKNSGIVFEPINRVHFYSNYYFIYTSMDIPNLKKDFLFIEENKEKVKLVCETLQEKELPTDCHMMVTQIELIENEIINLNEEIIHLTNVHARKKRSYVDGVGNLLNTLFGTMDSKDAEKIYGKIAELDTDEQQLLDAEKQQVYIVKSIYNELNETIEQSIINRQEINTKIDDLAYEIKNFATIYNDVQRKVIILDMSMLITLEMTNIARKLDTITSILNSLLAGRLHPLILANEKIQKIYIKLAEKMGLKVETEIYQALARVIEVDHISRNGQIIIKIQIPNPTESVFQLYGIFLLPMKTQAENSSIIYDINVDYIATDALQSKFILLDQQEIKNCEKLGINDVKTSSICKQNGPTITSTHEDCLLTLFKNSGVDEPSCKFKALRRKNMWIPMHNNNEWLFSTVREIQVKINYDSGKSDTLSIRGNGHIKIYKPATLKIEELNFRSTSKETLNTTLIRPSKDYKANIKINEVIEKIILPKETDAETKYLKAANTLKSNKDLINEGHNINELQIKLSHIESMRKEHKHTMQIHTGITISLFTIICAGFIIFYVMKRILISRKVYRREQIEMKILDIAPRVQATLNNASENTVEAD